MVSEAIFSDTPLPARPASRPKRSRSRSRCLPKIMLSTAALPCWTLCRAFCPGAARAAAPGAVGLPYILAGDAFHPATGESFSVVALSDDRLCLRGSAAPRYFTGHRGRVNDVAFGADASSLYSCGDDSAVLVWDARSPNGRPAQRLTVEGAGAGVRCVDVGCDGRLLAAGTAAGRDSAVVFWDVRAMGKPPPSSRAISCAPHRCS